MSAHAIPTEVVVPKFAGSGKITQAIQLTPMPSGRELLVQVKANALCGSERGQFAHGSDITPGHEAAGIVAASGPEATIPPGTLGAVYLMDFCGQCRSCQSGFTNQCLAKRGDIGFNRNGGYGAYALVPEHMFFPVDADITPVEATLLLDIMGTGGHCLKRAMLVRSDLETLLIAGAGPIGLGALAMAKLIFGPELPVALFDVNPYRLDLARRLGGLAFSVGGQSVQAGLESLGLGSIDVFIDTTGRQQARQAGLQALGQRGCAVMVGHGERLELDVSPDLIASERAVLGSEYFAYSEFAGNLRLLKEHRAYLGRIITHRFPVTALQEAFELFFTGGSGKVVIEQ